MGWIKVCDENSLKNGDLMEYDNGEMKILITKIKDKIFATDRICTHAYADLSTGFLNEEEKPLLVHYTCHLLIWKAGTSKRASRIAFKDL